MEAFRLIVPITAQTAFAIAAQTAFALVGLVVTRRIWHPCSRRAQAACVAVVFALGTQALELSVLVALRASEEFDRWGMVALMLAVGSIAGSVALALVLERARSALYLGGGEGAALKAAWWLVRAGLPLEMATVTAVFGFGSEISRGFVVPTALFAAVLSVGAFGTARLLRAAARHIAKR